MASFNNTAKRIQNGGWARQARVDDFAISKEFSGVRLTAGGICELAPGRRTGDHDPRQLSVTHLDAEGQPYVGRSRSISRLATLATWAI
jgi:oxalate decarboxylase